MLDTVQEPTVAESGPSEGGAVPVSDLPVGLIPLVAVKTFDRLNLSDGVRTNVDAFIEEQMSREALELAGLKPRHKLLMSGPPGNGKTALAGALAVALGVDAYLVSYDQIISPQVGRTSANLNAVFEFAEAKPTMLFFDEFDAIGRERGDDQETGEMKRVTSTLLTQLDRVPSHVVCVGATNHAGMLDGAIWRRFNMRLELPMPHLDLFEPFMHEMFENYRAKARGDLRMGPITVDLSLVAYRLGFENFSDCELFCTNCYRAFVLAKGALDIDGAIRASADAWSSGQQRVT